MRILFVPLALLLLALCSSASVISWTSVNTKSSKSTSNIISTSTSQETAKKVTANIGTTAAGKMPESQTAVLLDRFANFFFILAIEAAKATVPEFFSNSLQNGLACEVSKDDIEQVIKAAGTDKPEERAHALKTYESETDDNTNVNCAKRHTPARKDEACFCDTTDPSFYCIALQFRRLAQQETGLQPCRDKAYEKLKAAGTGMLAKMYEVDDFDKNDAFKDIFESSVSGIDAITAAGVGAEHKFWCDALNPEVYDAVKGLFASDGMYWFGDGFILALVFGPYHTNIETACKDSTFAASKYGSCLCKKETGFSFCIYNALAKVFQEAGFLECPADFKGGKLNPANKPTALPSFAPPKRAAPPPGQGGSDGGSGTTGAATTATGFFSLALATVALLARQ